MKLIGNPVLAGLLAASTVAFGIPGAQAQPFDHGRAMQVHQWRGGPERGGFGRGGMGMLRGLDLTEAQRDQVFKIFHEQAPAIRERVKTARAARDELRKATLSQNFDSARARQAADAVGKADADAAYARAETMSKVLAVLTPEQRAKLEQRRAQGPRRGWR